MNAWSAPNFILLTSKTSPLQSGALTTDEGALVIAVVYVGCFIGTLAAALSTERFGRKNLLLILPIPQLTCLALIYFATNVYYLYAARLLMGIAVGAAVSLIPRFITELADDKIRGALGSTPSLFWTTGSIFGFIIADNFDYYAQIATYSFIPLIFFIAFIFVPEAPEFLLGKNKQELFEKSYRFYRGSIDKTHSAKLNEKVEKNSVAFSDFCTKRAKKALLLTIILTVLTRFNGSVVLSNYMTIIFKKAKPALTPIHSSIVVATVELFANFLATSLIDRFGRKILLTTSTFGSALGLISLGLYVMFRDQLVEYNWIPIVSYAVTVLLQTMGITSLYGLLVCEILPEKIKSAGILINYSLKWALSFVILRSYPLMAQSIGIHGCMFYFAFCGIVGAVFMVSAFPETKGKSYEEIMKTLDNDLHENQ